MSPVCELCGKSDGKVKFHVGGCVTWAHESCGEIADKAIDAFFDWVVIVDGGVIQLTDLLVKALERKELRAVPRPETVSSFPSKLMGKNKGRSAEASTCRQRREDEGKPKER